MIDKICHYCQMGTAGNHEVGCPCNPVVMVSGGYVSPDLIAKITELKACDNCKQLVAEIAQLRINQDYLRNAIDRVHDKLCPNQTGTWQMRVEQVISSAENLKQLESTCQRLRELAGELWEKYSNPHSVYFHKPDGELEQRLKAEGVKK